MKTKQSKNDGVGKIVKAGLIGAVACVAFVAALAALSAVLMDRGLFDESNDALLGAIARMVGIFAGVALSVKLVPEKKIQVAALSLGVVLFLMIGGTILLWDGVFVQLLVNLLGCVLSGAASVAVSMIPKKGKRSLRTRYRYR